MKSYVFRVVAEEDARASGEGAYHAYGPTLKGCHSLTRVKRPPPSAGHPATVLRAPANQPSRFSTSLTFLTRKPGANWLMESKKNSEVSILLSYVPWAAIANTTRRTRGGL